MHKLTRPNSPKCLGRYQKDRKKWADVTNADKDEIWTQLNEMQQQRCAYCEADISQKESKNVHHIEHFRQCSAKRYPQGTFLWSNIFGSCNRINCCGKHKDLLPSYDHTDLIKMDDEDPEKFLHFLPDGTVIPVMGLCERNRHRALETIRVFNLNGPLRQIRASAIYGYIQMAEEIADLAAEYDESEWRPILDEELATVKNLPFVTAIRHVLLP